MPKCFFDNTNACVIECKLVMDYPDSRLDTRNYRGSSIEARGTVNLLLSGTVLIVETVNQINQIKCWVLRKGENRSSRRKTSQSRVENQKTWPSPGPGIEPRTHWWEASALTTAPSLLPCHPCSPTADIAASLYHQDVKVLLSVSIHFFLVK